MTVTVYKSNDSGAPTMDGNAGSLITVLKAVLVNGYGSKAAAGWTLAIEDAPNYKAIFRNNPITGTGRYFWFRDDGVLYSGHGGSKVNYVFRGCESYTDIDTTAGNFPNVAGADTSDSSTYYGTTSRKAQINNDSNPVPWIIFADDRTCYISTCFQDQGGTDPFAVAFDENTKRMKAVIGDYEPLNGSVDPYASLVIGTHFTTGGTNDQYFGYGDLTLDKINGHFINRGMEGNAGAIEFSKGPLVSFTNKIYLGGAAAGGAGNFMKYPSPTAGGLVLSPIVVQEKTNAVERTDSHTNYFAGKRGLLRGIMSTPHTCKSGEASKLGDVGDTFTHNGRTYMIMTAGYSSSNITFCVDTTGPW